ncbi:uncharacterized protein VDAG_02367 [Verticillium dahliae VdLs.17]|uniref:Azaphilone pigments biosynthesis cluster protein L N-terminal domain-containing protein n=1 Tax=Verticillium dahliae (strain VdLs.17 / ATCC MYA-4575 / FGSC 10137) TaxID=498257 RepID=G2WXN5_VERDV|nr:uncharacterized protein VDAG_02367 [Verticillium dahliae VdLs.17]EGY20843.1 hypothetical protein VDAG_02367 [Verticillium dahliae VdLs.17]
MADPLSISASILGVVTAAIVTTRSLKETVQRFRDRDRSLRRLVEQLTDLITVLDALQEVAHVEASMLTLLEGPVDRCRQLCHEFQDAMEDFKGKSSMGFRDWTKMEFMKGDINEFMDTLSGYKSTISVGLGTITLQMSKATQDVLERYSEMVQDTSYDLKIHLQRIDEKMALFTSEIPGASNIDLKDERAVTAHCIRICEDAQSYLDSLVDQKRPSRLQTPPAHPATAEPTSFEAHRETHKVLSDNRNNVAEHLGRLRERYDRLVSDGKAASDRETSRLEQDIKALKECLEVCELASGEVSRQRIHTIGEVVADGDSDQVVVTTLADVFDVKKALSKGRSAQLIGSMTDESLRQLSQDRYGSRFGSSARVETDVATHAIVENPGTNRQRQATLDGQRRELSSRARAYPNEVRKRATEGDKKDAE